MKPLVYIASPYTKGDVAMNTHFQCRVFDQLLTDGRVTPIVPLWSHFQHTVIPTPYEDWVDYDNEIIARCDACVRLNASIPSMHYLQVESSGADAEVDLFLAAGKPVFYSVEALLQWADTL